ncbi:MAG: enoyl-CoA hydratase-related protein, partial [Thermocrispum sp.]
QQLAAQLAAGPGAAYREIKQVLAGARTSTLADALKAEDAAQTRLGSTHDHREAVDAFVNKRAPKFTGS